MRIIEGIGTLQFDEGAKELRIGAMIDPPEMVEFVDDENWLYRVPEGAEEAYVEIPLENESVVAITVYARKAADTSLAIVRPGGMFEILPMLIGVRTRHIVKMPALHELEALCLMFNQDCHIYVESSRPRPSEPVKSFKPLPPVEPEDGPTLMTEADVIRIMRNHQMGLIEETTVGEEEDAPRQIGNVPDDEWELNPSKATLLPEDEDEEEDEGNAEDTSDGDGEGGSSDRNGDDEGSSQDSETADQRRREASGGDHGGQSDPAGGAGAEGEGKG